MAGIIGDPVAHSLSPAMHNAAYRACDVDWVYVALPAAAGTGAAAVTSAFALGLAGLSVTMPHKRQAAAAVDRLTPTAAKLGAVNTVTPTAGGLLGDSTDGAGLLAALRLSHGWEPSGRRCVVLGAGGAARAVALAVAGAGAARVTVVARDAVSAASCAALAGAAGVVGEVGDVARADAVVDATSVGMGPDPGTLPLGLAPGDLRAGQLVVDLVYSPPATPLLRAASAAGAVAVNGLGMLVHQAALQFEAWTGVAAPVGVMAAAAGA